MNKSNFIFIFKKYFSLLLLSAFFILPSQYIHAYETTAKQAILMDYDTGFVLYKKSADEEMTPSSMTKMMTTYIAFEDLQKKRVTLKDTLPVSEKAWRMGGSKMFVELGNSIPFEDLLRGIIVQSGNDACVVVAEGLAGSEEAFAKRMTQKARNIGMKKSVFKNASGWPAEGHFVTARDLAVLAKATIEHFPEYYHYYNEESYTYHNIQQWNRNPILGRVSGVDGLKTGHTEDGGYGLTASAVRDGRRLILVVNGLESEKARAEESRRMMEWGFRAFENHLLFKGNTVIDNAQVWLGKQSEVPLISPKDIIITLPKGAMNKTKVKLSYTGPVPAPIKKGDEIAHLVIEVPGQETAKIPLQASKDIFQSSFLSRQFKAFFGTIKGQFSFSVDKNILEKALPKNNE